MTHFVYILGLIVFTSQVYANSTELSDSIPPLLVPKHSRLNPWIGVSNSTFPTPSQHRQPTIFCDFRNLPIAQPHLFSLLLNSTWRIGSQNPKSHLAGNNLFIPIPIHSQLQSYHQIVYSAGISQQCHGIIIQLKINPKTSVKTGIGIIHTNQYGYNYNTPILGKIEYIRQLNPKHYLILHAHSISSGLQNRGDAEEYYRVQTATGLYHSNLSLFQQAGLSWYYPQLSSWHVETAVISAGNLVKIPWSVKAKVSNTGSQFSMQTWIPIHQGRIDWIECNYNSQFIPIYISVCGKYNSSHTPRNSLDVHWKMGAAFSQHVGIIPQLQLLIQPQ